jgi:uncharacterized protein YdbL (DUF1318 family)
MLTYGVIPWRLVMMTLMMASKDGPLGETLGTYLGLLHSNTYLSLNSRSQLAFQVFVPFRFA